MEKIEVGSAPFRYIVLAFICGVLALCFIIQIILVLTNPTTWMALNHNPAALFSLIGNHQ